MSSCKISTEMDCFAALAMTRLLVTTANNFVIASAAKQSMVQLKKLPAVYIMANQRRGTLYTGVTSNLAQRAHQHRTGLVSGFTAKYQCKLLVWYEAHASMESAILREKQIKAGSRAKKIALIETVNRDWRDLFAEIT